jgi:hypothetical protein
VLQRQVFVRRKAFSSAYFCRLLLFGLILTVGCRAERDAQLRQLYRDGISFLTETEAKLRASRSASEAASVAENALPGLRRLIERKRELERRYPELADVTKREQVHAQFPEFHELRKAARSIYAYGGVLALRYKSDPRFVKASREAWELMAYF